MKKHQLKHATVLQRAVVQKKEIRIEIPSQKVVAKVDKKLLETKNKQIASARRIQQFWRDGRNRLKWKNTAEGLRNKQKENFASGVLLVMLMLQVAAGLIRWYTGIALSGVVMGMNYYLFMLVWASTLPLKSTWQLKIGFALPPYLVIMGR